MSSLIPTVDLSGDLRLLGFIVSKTTGIAWSNQVGGIACYHPTLEGLYIPLPFSWLKEGFRGFEFNQDDIVEMLSLNNHLRSRFEAPAYFPQLEVCCEAWVPLRVKEDPCCSLLAPFKGELGILTYSNSD